MDNITKENFINELVNSVTADVLREVKKYPENWDGIELRWRIADAFGQTVIGNIGDRKGKRYRDYKNTVLVDNLM